ncbi:phosphate ABC transporter, permease protein PstA [Ornithinimicrobium sp. CNJ-824]|uniref:phosphate ABC transporter permease PstA n=1 Tax=Ornithinimicrobium sp. CNJ-824 TaxID=1904966 RepID=UPI0009646FE1|nr:phosphate ABC transporter permease PstA [Ornithinimicrobium sp. CNJ-824]OLT21465.1 phosphate ABC transporter, permease protein PstA [Ornithinimicrobium sp. CNJ-824]
MSAPTDRRPADRDPRTPDDLHHSRLDDVPGIVASTVRPASTRPAWMLAVAFVLVGLALWQLLDLHVAAAVALAFVGYLVVLYVVYLRLGGERVAKDHLVRALVYFAFALAILPLVSLLWTVVAQGAGRAFDPDFLNQTMNGVTGLNDQRYASGEADFVGGAYHAIMGTLIITGMATLISVPIGMFTAIYLVEYGGGNRLSKSIRFFVDVMTGIPSIVAGLFAFALFTQIFGIRDAKMGLAGAVALSVLMIPTVVRNSEEMLRIVPNELREASLALGVPKWRTIAKVVLPTAASGLASGITLAIARVIGETAPLLVAIGYARGLNWNPLEGPMNTLAVYAYFMFTKPLSPAVRDPSLERAWAAALLLVLIVVALNLLARLIAKLFAPKSGR